MNLLEFYLNLSLNHECFKLPEKDKKYLLKNNFLSEYFSEEDKAQVRSNLGITTLLDELKGFILAKLFNEEGNVTFDLEPHEDAFDKVLSSAVIYNILLKYYTKEELDEWRERLVTEIYNKILELLNSIRIDDLLDRNSKYPVLNKVIKQALDELLNRIDNISETGPSTNIKVDSELSETSKNPLLNKVIKLLLDDKVDSSQLENYVTSELLLNLLSNLSDVINTEKERAQNSESLLDSKINNNKTLIDNILDLITRLIKHVFITQSAYDALETYERDTLYFIIEQEDINWTFGNAFPIILQ